MSSERVNILQQLVSTKHMRTVTVRRNGQSKTLPVGFSFTTFFFGFWPSVFRADLRFVALAFVTGLLPWTYLVWNYENASYFFQDHNYFWPIFLIVRMCLAIIRNEWLLRYHLEDGWKVSLQRRYRKPHTPEWLDSDVGEQW